MSERDTFEFPLKTLPRPKGKATQVIYTVYELPRPDASPHDTVFDRQGNLWYSDFNSQFIGKLDLKTGKVVDYVVPQSRGFQTAQGGLQIDIDKEGRLYFGNMFQMALARFDPKTEKFDVHKLPMPESTYGDGHVTMIDPAFQHLDGKLWLNVAYDTGTAGGTWQVDVANNKWTQVKYPEGSPSARAYDVVATSKNDMYGIGLAVDKIWITNGKTLQTTWYDLPTKGPGCRRGHVDAQDRLWCAVFQGNRLAMFDPRTKKITEWTVPTEWTRPYDAQFDDRGYLWTAGMDADLAVRMNVETGEFVQYCCPIAPTCARSTCSRQEPSPACGWAISTGIQSRASSRSRPEPVSYRTSGAALRRARLAVRPLRRILPDPPEEDHHDRPARLAAADDGFERWEPRSQASDAFTRGSKLAALRTCFRASNR